MGNVKYLGVSMDPKFNWRPNIESRVISLYSLLRQQEDLREKMEPPVDKSPLDGHNHDSTHSSARFGCVLAGVSKQCSKVHLNKVQRTACASATTALQY